MAPARTGRFPKVKTESRDNFLPSLAGEANGLPVATSDRSDLRFASSWGGATTGKSTEQRGKEYVSWMASSCPFDLLRITIEFHISVACGSRCMEGVTILHACIGQRFLDRLLELEESSRTLHFETAA